MDIDYDVIKSLSKFFQSKVLGLSPERIRTVLKNDNHKIVKYKEFKTDGYYVNLIDITDRRSYSVKNKTILGLSLQPLSENNKIVLSIEKADQSYGIINENKIVLNGEYALKYINKDYNSTRGYQYKEDDVVLYINSTLTKEKFFEKILMSDIKLEWKYFEFAMKFKEELKSLNKKIEVQFSEIDNDILKRTIL